MADIIKHKRSATAAAVPTAGQLSLGELAINTADGKVYLKKSDGSVVLLGADKEGAIAAGTTAQYWRGDKTWQDLPAAVRAALLTDLSTASSADVAATDTVLAAIGKLQAGKFGRSNILGTVSQSAGAPTGAIIERGSNANGEYVRFADGTLLCISPQYTDGGCTATTGVLYTSGAAGAVTWEYPAEFSNVPFTACTTAEPSGWCDTTGATTLSVASRRFRGSSDATGRAVEFLAIGRWYNP